MLEFFFSANNGSSWGAVNNGLTYQQVSTLAISGTNLFAGTNGGIFLSSNNGTSWSAVNNGLTSQYVNALAISGSNIFAATEGGVFLSTNNGNTWTTLNTGLSNAGVYSLATNGTNFFAGTDGSGVYINSTLLNLNDVISNNNLKINIYPNPASNQITIDNGQFSKGQVVTITVYDVIGKLQLHLKTTANTIDVSSILRQRNFHLPPASA